MVSSRPGGGGGPGRRHSAGTRKGASGGSRRDARGSRQGGSPPKRRRDRPAVAQARSESSPAQPAGPASGSAGSQRASGGRRRYGFTTRAIALAVVMLILIISYASSLRVYVKQRHEIAETKSQIAHSRKHIDQLHDEIDRWHDDDYVRIQARERLGWVKPGETGYRVVGSDGKPITKHSGIADDSDSDSDAKKESAWYEKLMGSMKHADHPPTKKHRDSQHTKKPITEHTKPKSDKPGS